MKYETGKKKIDSSTNEETLIVDKVKQTIERIFNAPTYDKVKKKLTLSEIQSIHHDCHHDKNFDYNLSALHCTTTLKQTNEQRYILNTHKGSELKSVSTQTVSCKAHQKMCRHKKGNSRQSCQNCGRAQILDHNPPQHTHDIRHKMDTVDISLSTDLASSDQFSSSSLMLQSSNRNENANCLKIIRLAKTIKIGSSMTRMCTGMIARLRREELAIIKIQKTYRRYTIMKQTNLRTIHLILIVRKIFRQQSNYMTQTIREKMKCIVWESWKTKCRFRSHLSSRAYKILHKQRLVLDEHFVIELNRIKSTRGKSSVSDYYLDLMRKWKALLGLMMSHKYKNRNQSKLFV